MEEKSQNLNLIYPPAIEKLQWGDWFSVPSDNPLIKYLSENLWDKSRIPEAWEGARLSGTAYLYREVSTGWTVFAKHYTEKTGDRAEKYSNREFRVTKKACSLGLDEGNIRAVKPLGAFGGVLLLEYVDGLTLEDTIAVRRSRPGTLTDGLKYSARLLAALHSNGLSPDKKPDFTSSVLKLQGIVDNLGKYGVLKEEPLIYEGLLSIVKSWKDKDFMKDYNTTFIHGDATSSNFIFPLSGGVVAIDWERFYTGDPASDTGRLIAEVSHSIIKHGGNPGEAVPFTKYLEDTYCEALPDSWDIDKIRKRIRFYRALSTLRIARNGWLSRLERTALVLQATVLLSV